MEKTYQPLVSVAVITYNSSKTVVETLDSIANQTYPYLELIVSDDCSTDNTVEICLDWIETHRERFVRTELLTIEKNTGVSANMNRAEAACQGEWVKPIAGDDVLFPECVMVYVDYVRKNPDSLIVFSRMEGFGKSEAEVEEYMNRVFDYSFFSLSIPEQMHRLIFIGNCLPAPTCFYNQTRLASLGIVGYDERIPMVEDYPRWIMLLKHGVRFYFVNKVLARYRLSENAISTTNHPSEIARKSNALVYMYYRYPEIKKDNWLRATHKYIKAAVEYREGAFWKVLNRCDMALSDALNKLGINVKV